MSKNVDTIIGMTETDAKIALKKMGVKEIRVMEKNGEKFMGACNYRLDRVNLRIKNDVVYNVSRG
jgi:hypothetical protein